MDEHASLHAEDDWAPTFDAVPDLILILDNQHRVVRANKAMAERMGCTPESLGEAWLRRVHPCGFMARGPRPGKRR